MESTINFSQGGVNARDGDYPLSSLQGNLNSNLAPRSKFFKFLSVDPNCLHK